MIHEKLLMETLDNLKLKVFVEDFEAEQIFYQIQEAKGNNLKILEEKIEKDYKRHMKSIESIKNRGNAEIGCSDDNSNELSIEDDEKDTSNSDYNNSIISNIEDDADIIDSEENTSSSDQNDSAEKTDSMSELNKSESDVSFDSEDWNASNSSDTELLNKPADEVLKIMKNIK